MYFEKILTETQPVQVISPIYGHSDNYINLYTPIQYSFSFNIDSEL